MSTTACTAVSYLPGCALYGKRWFIRRVLLMLCPSRLSGIRFRNTTISFCWIFSIELRTLIQYLPFCFTISRFVKDSCVKIIFKSIYYYILEPGALWKGKLHLYIFYYIIWFVWVELASHQSRVLELVLKCDSNASAEIIHQILDINAYMVYTSIYM